MFEQQKMRTINKVMNKGKVMNKDIHRRRGELGIPRSFVQFVCLYTLILTGLSVDQAAATESRYVRVP